MDLESVILSAAGQTQKDRYHMISCCCGAQEGWEELLHIQGQEGRCEKIPLVQGKEQRLHFTGAAVKRYPTSEVRETQVRR